MASDKDSIILSDVSINGDIVEKEKLVFNGKLNGDINADEVETHANSYIKGNIKAAKTFFGGTLKGNISGDTIRLNKTSDVEGVLNQKNLSIEEGATLKIKTETYK